MRCINLRWSWTIICIHQYDTALFGLSCFLLSLVSTRHLRSYHTWSLVSVYYLPNWASLIVPRWLRTLVIIATHGKSKNGVPALFSKWLMIRCAWFAILTLLLVALHPAIDYNVFSEHKKHPKLLWAWTVLPRTSAHKINQSCMQM